MLVHSVSLGVGIGVVLGLIKIIFNIYILYFLLPVYWLAVVSIF